MENIHDLPNMELRTGKNRFWVAHFIIPVLNPTRYLPARIGFYIQEIASG
jgi:hypothetical protein